ncbi:hypothetical protein CPB84DRAFT_1774823 [Gymnopilus junonius]|uniref:C3H1-type domain-containing protein n=1 Tax=Gymnopilus junonius TaxID=109634 RepID=A0A9P5NNC3_GYMJU|nr:hypothetical protein CPB84DRAFT_1774823 [Gymnopilus junonius]
MSPMTFIPEPQTEMCSYYSAGFANEVASGPVAGWAGVPRDGVYPDGPPIYGAYAPFPQSWPSPTYPSLSPAIESALLNHPPRSRDSIETASTSVSSLESDDSNVVTEDPQFQEHPHSHQSQVCISDESPIIHVPPFLPLSYINTTVTLSPSPAYDFAYPTLTGLKLPGPMKPKVSKPPSKQKILKYKTKPCKFFQTERGCPNGSACTFIHDESLSDTSSSPQKASSPIKEDLDRKSFIPVPWRVIGGGVLVGIKKDGADDNSAFDSEDSSSEDPHPQIFKKAVTPINTITRKRSNSIPSTPSVAQTKFGSLFSAESPGVL